MTEARARWIAQSIADQSGVDAYVVRSLGHSPKADPRVAYFPATAMEMETVFRWPVSEHVRTIRPTRHQRSTREKPPSLPN